MDSILVDVIYVGAGPAGYVGAIRASQLGLKVAVVEKNPTLGGTCLNVGCIPSKVLLETTEFYDQLVHQSSRWGLKVSNPQWDLVAWQAHKDRVVQELTRGIEYLFQKNQISWVKGTGRVVDGHTVQVLSSDGTNLELKARLGVVLAVGSEPRQLPGVSFDEQRILSSTGALSLTQIPSHLVVVGGGVIGLELGSVWARLGAQVTILESGARLCGFLDSDAAQVLVQALKKKGVEIITQCRVQEVIPDPSEPIVKVTFETPQGVQMRQASHVLVAIGRQPLSRNVGLPLETDEKGFVRVTSDWRTSIPGLYAVGDLIDGPMLAHKAEEDGTGVAEVLAGRRRHRHYDTCPFVIYTFPEVAWVGLTQQEAEAQGRKVRIGKFPFSANGRAKTLDQTMGFVKFVAEEASDRILGLTIVGPRASEMIHLGVLGMEFQASCEDLARSFWAHPTLSEAVKEAAWAAFDKPRHI